MVLYCDLLLLQAPVRISSTLHVWWTCRRMPSRDGSPLRLWSTACMSLFWLPLVDVGSLSGVIIMEQVGTALLGASRVMPGWYSHSLSLLLIVRTSLLHTAPNPRRVSTMGLCLMGSPQREPLLRKRRWRLGRMMAHVVGWPVSSNRSRDSWLPVTMQIIELRLQWAWMMFHGPLASSTLGVWDCLPRGSVERDHLLLLTKMWTLYRHLAFNEVFSI